MPVRNATNYRDELGFLSVFAKCNLNQAVDNLPSLWSKLSTHSTHESGQALVPSFFLFAVAMETIPVNFVLWTSVSLSFLDALRVAWVMKPREFAWVLCSTPMQCGVSALTASAATLFLTIECCKLAESGCRRDNSSETRVFSLHSEMLQVNRLLLRVTPNMFPWTATNIANLLKIKFTRFKEWEGT